MILFSSCIKVKREFHPKGNLKSITHYRFGKETGTTIYYHHWYPTKIMEVEMKRGKKNGKFIKRYFNNNVEVEAYYKNDLIEGIEKQYYQNGNLSVETHYIKGMKNGKVTSWYSNGYVRELGAFVNDMFDGEWVNYDNRGLLVGEAFFVKGAGKRATYDEMGRLQCETNFVNNKKDGLEIWYFHSGDVEKKLLFKEDRIIEINGVPIDSL
jgi:antitoxin component YwqK of YwqJK toxin-antitoxin module